MQETLITGRKAKKLYINIVSSGKKGSNRAEIGVLVRDNYGRVLEDHRETVNGCRGGLGDYKAAIRALEIASRYCRDRIYIFTKNRFLVNHIYGSYRTKNREVSKLVIEIKFLEGFFKCVRFFRVKD